MKRGRKPTRKDPPYIGLAESIEIARTMYERMGGTASRDDLGGLFGNTPRSSSFERKTRAMRSYGLLDESGTNTYRLTPLAVQIVAPTSGSEEAQARVNVFRNIDVFARIHDLYKGKVCPEESFLANTIEREVGVGPDAKYRWAKMFMESLKAAGLYSEQGGRIVVRADSSMVESRPVDFRSRIEEKETEMETTGQETTTQENHAQPGVVRLIFPIRGRIEAKIFIPENLTREEADKLITVVNTCVVVKKEQKN